MRKGWLLVAVCATATVCAANLAAQYAAQDTKQDSLQATVDQASPVTVRGNGVCECAKERRCVTPKIPRSKLRACPATASRVHRPVASDETTVREPPRSEEHTSELQS